jgi:ketosteroid isomerase-like protein
MSQENIDAVRRGYDSWRDRRSLDFDLLDLNIEWRTADLLDGGVVLHGHEGVRNWFRQMDQIWDDMWWDVERLGDAGDQVVAITRAHARGRDSGAMTELVIGTVWTIRDGKAVRVETYMDPADALEAVGLSE